MFYSSNFQLLEHTSKLTELTLMVVTSSGCQNHNLELDKSVFVKLLRLKILFTFSLFYFMFHQIMINYTKVNLSSASSICALLGLSSKEIFCLQLYCHRTQYWPIIHLFKFESRDVLSRQNVIQIEPCWQR